jgi:hypothetical protein
MNYLMIQGDPVLPLLASPLGNEFDIFAWLTPLEISVGIAPISRSFGL